MTTKPAAGEFAPYYGKYISLVEGDDILRALEEQNGATLGVLRSRTEAQGNYRYEPGKWSIKEVVGHLIDTERIFAYRALRIARDDKTPLPGFEQDDYVASADFDASQLADLAAQFALVRQSNLAMFRQFSDEAWLRRGTASENPVTVRALAYIIAGHELHHLRLLRSRYL
jgi:uncharacterized damage-inducible protein DinB